MNPFEQDIAAPEPPPLTPAEVEARRGRLAELFESEREKFLGMATRRTGREDAEDVVQGAFLSAWESVHTCRDIEAMKAWLYVIFQRYSTRHISVAIERRNQVDLASAPELGDSRNPYDPERRLLMEEVKAEASRLSDKERGAILAHLTDENISQKLHKRRFHGVQRIKARVSGPEVVYRLS